MTERKYTNRSYLDALEKKVLVFDGAMGTSLQNQHLTAEHFGGEQYNGCNDYLVISYPEAVEKVHRSFLEVGVDVIETNTFRSNQITMKEYKLQDRVIEINETAARLARRLADEYSQITNQKSKIQNRFVAGSIGPSGKLPSASDPELSNVSFDELADVFREQAVGLIRGGVDVLLIETSQDILEVKAAITGIHQAFDENSNRFADPGSDHARYDWTHVARHERRSRARHPRRSRHRCHRPQLFHRTRAHARAHPHPR